MNNTSLSGFLLFFFSMLLTTSCKSPDVMEGWEDLDLLPYGVPFSIKAPVESKINASSLGLRRDITIRNTEENFDLQLFVSDATTTRPEIVVEREKNLITSDLRFIRFIKQDDNGFIYELEFTEDKPNYDFRYVRIMGDKEYIFQTGLIGLFTQESVEAMYKAVQ